MVSKSQDVVNDELKGIVRAIKIWGMVFDILFVMPQHKKLRNNKTKQLYISRIVKGMYIYVGVWGGEGKRILRSRRERKIQRSILF